MTVRRLEHVGIVVDDLPAATEFFVALGLEAGYEGSIEGDWVDRIIGLEGASSDVVHLQTPGGEGGGIELVKFKSPPYEGAAGPEPSNAPGIRHLAFTVDDLDVALARLEALGGELVGTVERYRDVYRLCYLRGPAGIIVELAEPLG